MRFFLCVFLMLSLVANTVSRLTGFEMLRPYEDWRMAKRSRLCLINAGLSQGCDLSDIIAAKQHASKFRSFAGPGRK